MFPLVAFSRKTSNYVGKTNEEKVSQKYMVIMKTI